MCLHPHARLSPSRELRGSREGHRSGTSFLLLPLCVTHNVVLTRTQTPSIFAYQSNHNLAWRPRVDGTFLLQDPQLLAEAQLFNRVPMINGGTYIPPHTPSQLLSSLEWDCRLMERRLRRRGNALLHHQHQHHDLQRLHQLRRSAVRSDSQRNGNRRSRRHPRSNLPDGPRSRLPLRDGVPKRPHSLVQDGGSVHGRHRLPGSPQALPLLLLAALPHLVLQCVVLELPGGS